MRGVRIANGVLSGLNALQGAVYCAVLGALYIRYQLTSDTLLQFVYFGPGGSFFVCGVAGAIASCADHKAVSIIQIVLNIMALIMVSVLCGLFFVLYLLLINLGTPVFIIVGLLFTLITTILASVLVCCGTRHEDHMNSTSKGVLQFNMM